MTGPLDDSPDPDQLTGRVLVVGDVHGDIEFLWSAADLAQRAGIRTIVQLGDLGVFWPGTEQWLGKVDRVLADHQIDRLVFVDGNHEGWTSRVPFPGSPAGGGLVAARQRAQATAEGFRVLSEWVQWADRATRWTWNGWRFGALGGAFSVDWRYRTPGRTWWPDHETPTSDDVDWLIAGGPLDVLLSHDAPFGGPIDEARPLPDDADTARSQAVRVLVRCAVNGTLPSLVVHGHWHHRYSQDLVWRVQRPQNPNASDPGWAHVRFEGLGANFSRFDDAVAVLDLTGPAPRVHPVHDQR